MLKKILRCFLVMLIFANIVVIAAKTTPDSANAKTNEFYTEDNQNILVTATHPEFTIQLKSNPTTGYSWFLREYDANIIIPVKHTFKEPSKESNSTLMGAPGYEFWTFRVKPAGFVVPQQTVIRMIYMRPWQGSNSTTQLVFRVTIEGK